MLLLLLPMRLPTRASCDRSRPAQKFLPAALRTHTRMPPRSCSSLTAWVVWSRWRHQRAAVHVSRHRRAHATFVCTPSRTPASGPAMYSARRPTLPAWGLQHAARTTHPGELLPQGFMECVAGCWPVKLDEADGGAGGVPAAPHKLKPRRKRERRRLLHGARVRGRETRWCWQRCSRAVGRSLRQMSQNARGYVPAAAASAAASLGALLNPLRRPQGLARTVVRVSTRT